MISKGFETDQQKTTKRKPHTASRSSNHHSNNESDDDVLNDTKLSEDPPNNENDLSSDSDEIEVEDDHAYDNQQKESAMRRSIKISDTTPPPQTSHETKSQKWKYFPLIILLFVLLCQLFKNGSDILSEDNNWRENVDPHHILSSHQRHTISAALKPILDKSYINEQETVSTLLILSSNENYAASLARCILKLVNTEASREKISTEMDLRSYHGDKLRLDSDLKYLLMSGGAIRTVVLRHIDAIPSNNAFEQLRLLFAYCDGENPVIPNRLIIMTATSTTQNETELRENFRTRWSKEHDFIDALMSRISGHTIFIDDGQKSIC